MKYTGHLSMFLNDSPCSCLSIDFNVNCYVVIPRIFFNSIYCKKVWKNIKKKNVIGYRNKGYLQAILSGSINLPICKHLTLRFFKLNNYFIICYFNIGLENELKNNRDKRNIRLPPTNWPRFPVFQL